jgi:hypothetical protein
MEIENAMPRSRKATFASSQFFGGFLSGWRCWSSVSMAVRLLNAELVSAGQQQYP